MDRDGAGIKGEVEAKNYLIEHEGYKIISENENMPRLGEIDLIAKDGDTLVFVEVKYRETAEFGYPLEAVSKVKQRKIIASAGKFLGNYKGKYNAVRFDVVGILGEKIEHVKDAFWARW